MRFFESAYRREALLSLILRNLKKYRHPAEIDKRTIDIAAHILEDYGPVSACQYLHCLIADELKPIQLSKMIVCEALMSGISYSDFLRQFGYVQTQGDV